MKGVDFDGKNLCAYRNDISTLFVYFITKILTIGIRIIISRIDKKVTSFKFWLTLFLFMDLPPIITTIIQGTYLEFLKEPLTVAVFLLSPIAFATIFRFYQTIFRTFSKLYIMKVFGGEEKKIIDFMTQLNKSLNSHWTLAAYLIVGSVLYFIVIWHGLLQGIDFALYWHGLPRLIVIYHKIWMLILWLGSFSFIFKVIILWREIRAVPIKMGEGTKEPHFIINLFHPDGGAGYKELSFLWLRVTVVGIIYGIGVILYAIGNEWDLISWILAITYLALAPLLVSVPFIYLHSLMASFKEKEISEFYKTWEPPKLRNRDPVKLDEIQKQYNNLRKLPTWPFGWKIGKLYWGFSVLPFIPTIIGIIDSLK